MSSFYQKRTEPFRFFTSSDSTFGSHLHRQAELLLVLEGSLTVSSGHREDTLAASEGILIFPNQIHGLCTAEHSKVLLCIFDGEFCHTYQKYFRSALPVCPVFRLDRLSPHSRVAVDGLLALSAECPGDNPLKPLTLSLGEGYLTLLLSCIFDKLELAQRTASDLDLEQRLLLYIDTHYTDNLSLEVLSREFGVSRFSLSRLFSDRFRTTFPAYVNAKRLEFARDLLSTTDLSVTQIAMDAGFGSSRTFFREFREAYRLSPGNYRRRQSRGHEQLLETRKNASGVLPCGT